jgi:ABC-type dipeptide/oligopeptide/nickel transport system ATPase subunit
VAVYLTTFGETAQALAQRKIELLVTHGLQTVFGEEMTFKLVAGTHGQQATLDFEITSTMEGIEVTTSVMDARGGGVASVVGFLLRLVVLLLTESASKLIVLDETFAQVSEEYEARVAEFLRELVDKTQVQIILITHSHAYTDAADRAYRFRLVDGATKVERLHSGTAA